MSQDVKLTTKEAAAYLRLQPCTLEAWRTKGRGPKYQKLGSRVIYDIDDIKFFAESNTVLTIDTAPELVRQRGE